MAGGTFVAENKIRPGVYIRFTSSRGLGLTVSDRGTVAIAQALSWGPVETVQTVEAGAEKYASCEDWNVTLDTAWAEDLEKVDSLETDMASRVAMMEPLTWLSGHYDAYGQSTVAPHWRVNEGLFDTDVSLCAAANLVFALRKYDGVAEVEHNPVWGRGHVLAERSGSAAANLLDWVVSCCSS